MYSLKYKLNSGMTVKESSTIVDMGRFQSREAAMDKYVDLTRAWKLKGIHADGQFILVNGAEHIYL